LAEFDHSRSSRDGRHHRCRECDRKRDKERLKNGSLARSHRRWAAHHPQAIAAHRALQKAVRRGEIKRGPCAECGKPSSHGHHDDYSKPLEVEWLCHRHHVEFHRLERLHGHGQLFFDFAKEGAL